VRRMLNARTKMKEQAWQVTDCGLRDSPSADLTVDAVERRDAAVQVAQSELDGRVVAKKPQASTFRDDSSDGHIPHGRRADNEEKQEWSGIVDGWKVGQPDH
jgi:hypothetical protein